MNCSAQFSLTPASRSVGASRTLSRRRTLLFRSRCDSVIKLYASSARSPPSAAHMTLPCKNCESSHFTLLMRRQRASPDPLRRASICSAWLAAPLTVVAFVLSGKLYMCARSATRSESLTSGASLPVSDAVDDAVCVVGEEQ